MSHDPDPDRWARLRFAIIGPLLAAPPERGELGKALEDLAPQAPLEAPGERDNAPVQLCDIGTLVLRGTQSPGPGSGTAPPGPQ